ncbi:MAG: ABC transporter ATP-binding protein [Bacteroidota bacterium]
MLSVTDVSVVLDERPILKGVSFHVGAGQIAGYVGPNGAGKTTTMRLLTGVLKPNAGRVLVGGIDVAAEPLAAKRRFGYVPEHGHLYESFTPAEYLTFVGRMHGLDETLLARRAEALLRFWKLDGVAQQRMNGFSKGMKQKVLISSALLHDPAVLLLDEPLTGLDAHAVLQFRALLKARAAAGVTVFYSSHLLDAVERVVDQVIVIRAGEIVRTASPQDLMTETASGSLESAFSQLTAAEDAEAQADVLEAEAFAS